MSWSSAATPGDDDLVYPRTLLRHAVFRVEVPPRQHLVAMRLPSSGRGPRNRRRRIVTDPVDPSPPQSGFDGRMLSGLGPVKLVLTDGPPVKPYEVLDGPPLNVVNGFRQWPAGCSYSGPDATRSESTRPTRPSRSTCRYSTGGDGRATSR